MKLIFQFIRPHWKLCVATILLLIVDVTGTLVISTFAAEMLNLGTSGASFEILFSTGIKQVVAKKNLRCAVERQETIGELTGIVEEYYNGRNVIKRRIITKTTAWNRLPPWKKTGLPTKRRTF